MHALQILELARQRQDGGDWGLRDPVNPAHHSLFGGPAASPPENQVRKLAAYSCPASLHVHWKRKGASP